MNVADSLVRMAQRDAARIALRFEGESYSYGELHRRAGSLAAGLARLGVEPGDRVALLLNNDPSYVTAYYAVHLLGGVVVSINAMNTQREVDLIVRDCGASALLVDSTLLDRIPAHAPHVIANQAVAAHPSFESVAAGCAPLTAGPELPPGAPAAILYTSGTTGTPKGATLSQANVVTNANAALECYAARADDRFLLFLPLFHCFGQNAIMNAAFAVGASIVLQRRFVPEAVLDALAAGEVTHFFAVPSVYLRLLQHDALRKTFERVRYVFSAAAPLPLEVARRFRDATGHTIHEGYGLTETSPFSTYNHRTRHRDGSVGTPVKDVAVRVVDTQGAEVRCGEVGEIIVSGPNVMLGYWNRPEATAETIRDGWLHTGDLGRFDEDGYLYVVDRLKEMINVSGFKVFPSEVENALCEHPAIAEPAVFGVPHPVSGEQVFAHIVLKAGAQLDADELRRFCAERIATYKIPARFEFVPVLPKNPAGKILRRVLRAEASAGVTGERFT